jgi:uncharacterized protein (TIGR02996 family)
MASEDSFLRAIIDAPDDDGVRLVYADWLDEHGHPARAEFIRLQCELATVPEGDPRRRKMKAREEALLKAHEEAWTAPLRAFASDCKFSGGLVTEITATIPALVEHGEQLFRLAPIRTIHVRYSESPDRSKAADGARRFAACPWLAHLMALDLCLAGLGQGEVEAILSSPHLTRLKLLVFGDQESSLATAKALAACPNLPRLTELFFLGDYYSDLGDAGLEVLASSPRLSGLQGLHCDNNDVGPAGARALAASPHLTQLRELHFGHGSYHPNQIGDEGLAALAGSPTFGQLRSLSLPMNAVGDAGLEAVAASPHLRRLEALSLPMNLVGDAGLAALAASPNLRSVSYLWLAANQIGPAGVAALAASPHAGELTTLGLLSNPIDEDGFRALVESPRLPRLTNVSLDTDTMSREMLGALRRRFGDPVKQ